MPRGGRRSGTPGTVYPQRTDLHQPVKTAPSTAYGQASASATQQSAMPLPAGGAAAGPTPVQAPPAGPPPGASPFDRPTDRPGEAITTGAPFGPGAGPDALAPAIDPVLEKLRAAYRTMPTDAIAALIEMAQQAGAQ